SRPAWDVILKGFGRHAPGLSAFRIHHIDIGVTYFVGVEGDLLSVWGPSGVPVEGAPNEVSCTGFEPSLADIQISSLPVRSEPKAIFFPSGEKSISNCVRVEEINLVGPLRGPDQFGPAVRQTFKFTFS